MFTKTYLPILQEAQSRAGVRGFSGAIETEFAKLVASGRRASPELAPLYRELQYRHPSTCLSCLSRFPLNSLTCGHRLCDDCVLSHWETGVLKRCPLCAWPNVVAFYPKPPGAGARVLRLEGELEDARGIATLLRRLCDHLSVSLRHYFEVLCCSGIGIFFGVMIFCQGATVEDCMYHISNVQHIKMSKTGFSFGPRLKFSFHELRKSQVKMVLCFKNGTVRSYDLDETKPLRTPDIPSLPIDQLAMRECAQLWPDAEIHAVINLERRQSDQISVSIIADKLVASSFYLELAEHVFWAKSPTAVQVIIKCRIPPGPILTDFAKKLHAKRIWIRLRIDDGPLESILLCPESVLAEVKRGNIFARPLRVLIPSPASTVDIQVEGIHSTGSTAINNSPCKVGSVAVGTLQEDKHRSLEASFELLEKQLASLQI